jgi:hypothetical protein
VSLLNLEGYSDRFEGQNKTVFRDPELVYTVNPEDPMRTIGDEEWYDEAALQAKVWDHNIQQLQEAGLPLTFDEYSKEMMFYEVADDRIDGKLTAPAIVIYDYEEVEPYESMKTFANISDYEEEQIREIQKELDGLIEDGELAVQKRETVKNDYRGPSCLRQFGRNDEDEVFLLEFGEHHPRLEGPYSGEDFLEEHGIEREKYGIRSPIMLGDMSSYSWQFND